MLSKGSIASHMIHEESEILLALEAAGVGLWHWDIKADLIRLSSRAKSLLDVSDSSLSLQKFLARLFEDERQDVLQTLNRCVAAQEDVDIDIHTLRGQSKDDAMWLRMRGGVSDCRSEMRGIFIDIAHRKEAEQSAYRLAAIVTSSEDAIIGKTLEGIVTDWNHAAEKIFGYTAEEMIGQSILRLLPPGDEAEESLILEKIKQGDRIDHYETKRRCKNGAMIDVSLTISPVYDNRGRLLGASKVARDVTSAKRSQLALAEREAHLQSVLDTVPDAMIVHDAQGKIRSFSATAERLFGYVAEEAIGQSFNMLFQQPYSEQQEDLTSNLFETSDKRIIGINRINRVLTGVRKDSSTFPMELSVGEMCWNDKRLFTAFMRDLTERHQTQLRLQEFQAELIHMSRFTALGEMASTLAHELNQPLTAAASYLKGAKKLLENDPDAGLPKACSAMQAAADQVLRAGEIIRRLRDFVARGENERQVENLPKLIEEASELALIGAKETSVRVSFELDPHAAFVLVDKVQVQQVLLNLIRNAMEAMQECSQRDLKISTHLLDEEMIKIDVADTGPGIADEIMQRLFQPFVTSKRNGMGVGLSISRTIIEAHGGHLWADSVSGEGTTFHLTLKAVCSEELADGE